MLILNLTRGNSTWRVPLRLPATPSDIAEAYSKLDQINGDERTTHITDVISEAVFLDRFLRGKHPDSFDELNELAQKLERMNEQELRAFDGALNAESINGIGDLLRIADSLEAYVFISGVTTEKELGRFLVDSGYKGFPENVRPYLDYAAIGAEYCAQRGGAFTSQGFTLRRSNAESLSPEESNWWKPIFRVYLQSPTWLEQRRDPYALELPATPKQLCAAQYDLEIPELGDAEQLKAECLLVDLEPYIPLEEADLVSLQDLSVVLSASMENYGEDLVLAVYEAKTPDDLEQACSLAMTLDRYEMVTTEPEEYGRNALYELCEDQEVLDAVDGFISWKDFGLSMMEEDGVISTSFGRIRGIEALSQERDMQMELS